MKRLWVWTAVALALGLVAGRAHALSTLAFEAVAETAADGATPAGKVYCGQTPVLTVSGNGWQAFTAAQALAKRLNQLAEEGLQAKEITIRREKKTRALVARGATLIVIDKKMAKSQHAGLDSLANSWLRHLRAQFKRPYLSMEPVTIPVGERRAVPLMGNLSGPVSVWTRGSGLTASWDHATRTVVLQGDSVGPCSLVVAIGSTELRVPVQVAKYAAQLIGSPVAVVTGEPATPEVVADAVRSAVDTSLKLEPGATSDVKAWLADGVSLPVGRSLSVPVSIAAQGLDYIPYRVRPNVLVKNEPLTLAPASLLLVSNSPERLLTPGLWFEGVLRDDASVRLLYHHVNSSHMPATLTVELWNIGETTARVHMIPGVAGPSYDEAWVGHRAAAQFLVNAARGSGWTLAIPPGTAVTAVSQEMPNNSIASGIVEFRTLGPANVSVRVYLRDGEEAIGARPVAHYEPMPGLGQFYYPQPRREVKAEYRVGGSWAFITIGDKAAHGMLDGDRLAGSYGVLYDITLTLTNPTSLPAQVALLMEQAGGPARGALLVDGQLLEAAMVRNHDDAPLAHYTLAPGETRRVHILTLPQAGSNYPVRLVARPA